VAYNLRGVTTNRGSIYDFNMVDEAYNLRKK